MNFFSKKRHIIIFHQKKISLSSQFFQDWENYADEELFHISVKEAKQILLRFLKTRPRSKQECYQRLLRNQFTEEEIQYTLGFFEKNQLLNDSLFATYLIQSVQNTRPLGELALKRKLKEKGLSDAVIEESLYQYLKNDQNFIQDGRKLIAHNEFRFQKYKNAFEKHNKMYQYLYSRGFKDETIQQILHDQ